MTNICTQRPLPAQTNIWSGILRGSGSTLRICLLLIVLVVELPLKYFELRKKAGYVNLIWSGRLTGKCQALDHNEMARKLR